uniref:Uncharacterized protein n=1 Tax=Manihot esculenta TaxID=3983 RepID=A0A2C9WJX0_MANES
MSMDQLKMARSRSLVFLTRFLRLAFGATTPYLRQLIQIMSTNHHNLHTTLEEHKSRNSNKKKQIEKSSILNSTRFATQNKR